MSHPLGFNLFPILISSVRLPKLIANPTALMSKSISFAVIKLQSRLLLTIRSSCVIKRLVLVFGGGSAYGESLSICRLLAIRTLE